MKTEITAQTMSCIFGTGYEDDFTALSHELQDFGVNHDIRTIKTHLDDNDVGSIIDIPVLARICSKKHYAFVQCFTITADNGMIVSHPTKGRCTTYEPIMIYVKGMAHEMCKSFTKITDIRKQLNANIDMRTLRLAAAGDITCLSGIPSSRLINVFLMHGINMNNLIIQKGYSFPVFARPPEIDVTPKKNSLSYMNLINAYLDESDELHRLQEKELANNDKIAKVINKDINDSSISKADSLLELAAITGIDLKE